MVDEAVGQEGVEERLDRRIRSPGVEEVSPELVHHLLVGELRQAAQAPQMRQIDGGQPRWLDRVEVPAAALHEERFAAIAEKRRNGSLERRVPAAVHDEVGVLADEAGGVDTERERLTPARSVAPEILLGFPVRPARMRLPLP